MSVSVLLEGTLKDGLVEQFEEICTDAFNVTRAFEGCQKIDLTLNVENKKFRRKSHDSKCFIRRNFKRGPS